MAVTFGVTYTDLEREFQGWALDDLSDDIDVWVDSEAARIEASLRQQGYVPETVEGYGTTDTLYRICKSTIIHSVATRVMSALNIDATEFAVNHGKLAAENYKLIKNMPESVTTNYDPDKQKGGPRTNKSLRNRGRDTWQSPRSRGPWYDKYPVI